jgi:hypothetical protein
MLALGRIAGAVSIQVVTNQLADYLRRRQVLCCTEFLESFFLDGVNEYSEARSLAFHGVFNRSSRWMLIKL